MRALAGKDADPVSLVNDTELSYRMNMRLESPPMKLPRLRSFVRTLEALGENAWLRDLQTDEFYLTPRFWQMLGYSPDEAPQGRQEFSKLIHPADYERVRMESARFIASEDTFLNLELRLLSKLGEWRWLHLRGREVIRDEMGNAHIAVGIITDVSDFWRQQAAALEAHERLSLAIDKSEAGLWELDIRTMALTLDERSLELHNLSPDLPMPIKEETWLHALDPECRKKTMNTLRRALSNDRVFSTEYSVGGGERWINPLGKPIAGEDGQPERFIGLSLDITERKRAERLIANMQSELVHASRASAMGTMAGTLAHELNQPLTAIANYATGGARVAKRANDERLIQAMEAIHENAQRAGEIIRRMRRMARTGEVQLEDLKFDELVLEAARHAKTGCEGVSFHLDLNDGATVQADAIQIQQVLINLIRNACQAMHAGEVKQPNLTIATNDIYEGVQVSVADNGPGIPPELISSIFETKVTTKSDGMGIGLSISRTIIEAHGGKIWGENTHEGARFVFTLPVKGLTFAGEAGRT